MKCQASPSAGCHHSNRANLTCVSLAETSHHLWRPLCVGVHTFLPQQTSYHSHSLES